MYSKKVQDAYNKLCQLNAESKKLREKSTEFVVEANKLSARSGESFARGYRINKTFAERGLLFAEGTLLSAKGRMFYVENNKLIVESDRLRGEGMVLFYEAVVSEFGKGAEVEWNGNNPIVDEWKYEENGHGPSTCDGKVVEIDGVKYKLTAV